jgi:5,10-methylenetetrahydromethanopterin reductase
MAALPLGLELFGEPSVPEMMTLAQGAEAIGYDSIWLTETRFTRDGVTTAAAVAAATERVRVATAVLNPYTRGAVLTAVTAATLDELAGGRFILGIGPGSPTVLERQGISFDRPLVRLRETVEVMRRLLRGEAVWFEGETISIAGARLDFVPLRAEIPIYFGVTGPRALALAGEIANGVVLNGFVSLSYTKRAAEIVRDAAHQAGRDPEAVEVTGSIHVAIDSDGHAARNAARPLIATYLAGFPHIARESGLDPELLDRIASVSRDQGLMASAALVSDSVVDALACVGTIDDVRQGLAERRRAGVTLPIVSLADRRMLSWLEELARPG